jgi:hypothetical protein
VRGDCPASTPGEAPKAPVEVDEIDTQKPAPRECHNGTACTPWDCTYPNCTFPPKKPEAPLQRGDKSELAHALRVLHGSKKPHAIPGGTGQQLGNESYRIIASGSQLEALMDAADALERHRTYTQPK